MARANQPYSYTLSWPLPASHLYRITVTAAKAGGKQTAFRLPAWRPGRYIIQNFAAAVSEFSATDASGKPLAWRKTDKDTWAVSNPETEQITVSYTYYANRRDAGSCYLDPTIAYFNPSNLFMYVEERLNEPCTLTLPGLPTAWQAATALTPTAKPNVYIAASYHELIDSPTIFAASLKQFDFEQDGVKFHLHFAGNYTAPAGDEQAAIKALQAIIHEGKGVFGELPMKEYHFIYYLMPFNIGHAVEHCYSAMFALPESAGASAEGMKRLYAISAHEFFHLWNVKRLRPAALWPYRYDQPVATSLHWFTEGVTEYYAYLLRVRAGLITQDEFLAAMSSNIQDLENDYAQRTISASEASTDSWLAGSAYQDPHTQISYYDLGERIGFLLDVELRRVSGGKQSLDKLMRYLYETYYKHDKGVPEEGVQQAAEKLTGQSFAHFFDTYVHGVGPFDYAPVLTPAGLSLNSEQDSKAGLSRIGILQTKVIDGGVILGAQWPGSDAAVAGLPEGKTLVRVNGQQYDQAATDALINALKPGDKLTLGLLGDDGASVATYTVTFTGKFVPHIYTLLPVAGTNTDWIKTWLGKTE